MLVIPEETKEYFCEVQKWVYDNRLHEEFDKGLLRLHLYGCTWAQQDLWKITLYKDFAPQSFTFVAEEKLDDGLYLHAFSGGFIFHGPHDGFGSGQAPSFSVSLDNSVGWQMHT